MTMDWNAFTPWTALPGGALIGLVATPMAWALVAPVPSPRVDSGLAGPVAGGLLVGVGTRYGSGCTSGHGVCGLSRLSPRSLVATLSLRGAGFATVRVLRHLPA